MEYAWPACFLYANAVHFDVSMAFWHVFDMQMLRILMFLVMVYALVAAFFV